jgi:hypothetical protein
MSRTARAAAATESAPKAVPARKELYSYEVRREGRVVVQLRALGAADGTVTVETEVYPVGQAAGEAISRPFEFPDADYARHFVDEALLALEYLNCSVVE